MTFPTHSDSAVTSYFGTPATAFSATLPSYSSGNIVVIKCKGDNQSANFSATGWTDKGNSTGSGPRYGSILARVMDGTEGSTVTINSAFMTAASFVAVAIDGHAGALSDVYVSTGTFFFADPDPPNLAPGIGAQDFLWLIAGGSREGAGNIGPSTGFSAFTDGEVDGGAGNVSATMFYRTENVASLDPGAMSNSASERGNVFTIAIAPAAGGGAYTLTADTGTLTLTGVAAGLAADRRLAAAAGALTLTGVAAGVAADRQLPADTSAVTLTGIAAGIAADHQLAADTGALTLTGVAADLAYSAAGATLSAETGAVSLTGIAASLAADRRLASDTGALTLTGIAAGLAADRRLAAAAGTLTLTGVAALLRAARRLAAATGSLALTGIAVTLTSTGSSAAAPGRLALTNTGAGAALTNTGGGVTLSGTP